MRSDDGFVEEVVDHAAVAGVEVPCRAVGVHADQHAGVMSFIASEVLLWPIEPDEVAREFGEEAAGQSSGGAVETVEYEDDDEDEGENPCGGLE